MTKMSYTWQDGPFNRHVEQQRRKHV